MARQSPVRPLTQASTGLVDSVRAIWNDDRRTRWAIFNDHVNMMRTAWPFVAGVVFVLLISLATTQGREALKYSVSPDYPGGWWRLGFTGLTMFLFAVAVHEVTLRTINVYYPFSSRANPLLERRFKFAALLALAVPVGLTLFFLHNWIRLADIETWSPPSWLSPVIWDDRLLITAIVVFFISAAYDFTAPAWRSPEASRPLRRVERLVQRALLVLITITLLVFTFNLVLGPIIEMIWGGVQQKLDMSSSSFWGFLIGLAATVLSAAVVFLTPTHFMLRRFYANTNQFLVFRKGRTWISQTLGLAYIAAIVALALYPAKVAGLVGPVATLLTAVFAIAGVFGFAAYLNARRQSVPMLLSLLGLAILSGVVSCSEYHNVQIAVETSTANSTTRDPAGLSVQGYEETVSQWVGARTGDPALEARPAIVVLAEGGGIRAALHTASVLSCLDAQDPHFNEDIFAMSGVSGGSVGIATYLSARTQLRAALGSGPGTNGDCAFAYDAAGQAPGSVRGILPYTASQFLQSDFFSPLLAGFLLRDFPLNATICVFLPCDSGMDRATVFENSFRRGFRGSLGEQTRAEGAEMAEDPLGFLEAVHGAGIGIGDAARRPEPVVILNTFDVQTGQPAIASNVRYASADADPAAFDTYPYWNVIDAIEAAEDGPVGQYLDVASASHLSARFPLISPPGRICASGTDCNLTSHGPFIDGGYYDNSGASGVHKAVQKLLELDPDRPITVLHIIFRPTESAEGEARLPTFFDFAVPMTGVMKARSVHGQVPIQQLCQTLVSAAQTSAAPPDKSCDDINVWLASSLEEHDGSDAPCFDTTYFDRGRVQWVRSPLQAKVGEICGGRTAPTDRFEVELPLGWLLGDAGETILNRVNDQTPALCDGLGLQCGRNPPAEQPIPELPADPS